MKSVALPNTPTDPGPVTIRARGCEKQIPSINIVADWRATASGKEFIINSAVKVDRALRAR